MRAHAQVRSRRLVALGALAGIVVVDQALKWWAWRHAGSVHINYGGDRLVPHTFGSFYKRPWTGALLDLVDSGLLVTAAFLFLRRPHSMLSTVAGCSIIGGWTSNLLDRLGMHYWTAPGSVRGVVDFMPINGHVYNVADLFIIAATPLFILTMGGAGLRRLLVRTHVASTPASTDNRRSRARRALFAVPAMFCLATAVAIGAANFGGTTAPTNSANAIHAATRIGTPQPIR
jgi:lipoprotein signal peptidase